MLSIAYQTIIPFIISASVVILITIIAEKFGTKTGGIFGSLPSTIIVAYIFIALNKGPDFASISVSVVPAEIGINILFLLIFTLLIKKSVYIAFFSSFIIWSILSFILWFVNFHNIYISIIICLSSMFVTFFILEKIIKIKSVSKKTVHYTISKILFRGFLAGLIITISVILSNLGEIISGIISVFPAIISSTMFISYYEHGSDFSRGFAKSMVIGSLSVMSYAATIHFTYPNFGIILGSIISLCVSIFVSLIIFKIKNKIS